MKKKFIIIVLIFSLAASYVGMAQSTNILQQNINERNTSETYGLQWEMEFGTDDRNCARYQGPQPIGDADNDGKNELLISGRDAAVRVMKWNENTQTYEQDQALHTPFYPFIECDAGGMAIGDVTNDGKNDIAATWYTTIYKYFAGRYWIAGFNPWIFFNQGGSPDCLIGDCDNDGKNELILSGGGGWNPNSPVGEIEVFRWNGLFLKRVAEWKDTAEPGYAYMAGLGDVNEDGNNEIVVAYSNKVMVLEWNTETKAFEGTEIYRSHDEWDSPFSIVCKDCDNDDKAEILVGFYAPHIMIFKWNGSDYETQFDKTWPDGEPVIEGIDVGDTDDDGLNEVAAGVGVTYLLQWDGNTYVEEATLPTYGWMAVVCIGDCDNDGKNEINCGNVDVPEGQPYMEWVFKYGWEPSN